MSCPTPAMIKRSTHASMKKMKRSWVFQLDESRGCPNKCSFCVHPKINGRRFRAFSPKRIVNQVKHLQETFGAMAFRFTGSNTPKSFLKRFSELVKSENLNIRLLLLCLRQYHRREHTQRI